MMCRMISVRDRQLQTESETRSGSFPMGHSQWMCSEYTEIINHLKHTLPVINQFKSWLITFEDLFPRFCWYSDCTNSEESLHWK